MDTELALLVKDAQNGSRSALEQVILHAQGMVYNLALRMLQRPLDAEDATQEILIKIMTHLGQFRGDSAFSTWVYRLSTNTLLNFSRHDAARSSLSFDELSLRLEQSLTYYEDTAEETVESAELIEEVRRSCTLGMLICLNVEDRLALILTEVMEVSGEEAASIMGVSSTAYRKRLSRARRSLVAFVSQQCGIINAEHPCRCHKHVNSKIAAGRLDPDHLQYQQAHDAQSAFHADRAASSMDQTTRAISLIRSHPAYTSKLDCQALIVRLLEPGDLDG